MIDARIAAGELNGQVKKHHRAPDVRFQHADLIASKDAHCDRCEMNRIRLRIIQQHDIGNLVPILG